jgi:dihydroxy-acid dehydratase
VRAHCFDALICIPNCDKITPGMLMGAARANVPTVFVSGGPMAAGRDPATGKAMDLASVFEAVGARAAGTIDDARLLELEAQACPTCGSCAGMFTANSMNCLCEALGIALPGNGTALAETPERKALACRAAEALMALVRDDVCFRDVVTTEAIHNAVALDVAMGGSTNTVLHVLALAHEADIDFPLSRFNDVAERTPHLVKISPAWDGRRQWHMQDVHEAGGVPAVLAELAKLPGVLHLDARTVHAPTLGDSLQGVTTANPACIRSAEAPHSARGGLCALFGSLAPQGAVVKIGAVPPDERRFRGPARVFEGEQAALAAANAGGIQSGDVVIVRQEGPRGGPGMREMLALTSFLMGSDIDRVALVTDGRFSGATRGFCVGHVGPEAAHGGPIALLRDGDVITINAVTGELSVALSDEELAASSAEAPPAPREPRRGWLGRYERLVTNASTGAVLA